MILCVTGKIAAGKNFVCSIFEQKGWLCIDADKIGHLAVEQARKKIISSFKKDAEDLGICLQNQDGSLNRKNLASLIFPRPELLKKQEDIVYPIITQEVKKIISQNPEKNIILNAAVLYKTPELLCLCDKILFVTAPALIRFFRVKKRDGIKTKNIIERFRAQKGLLQKYKEFGKELCIVNNFTSMKNLSKSLQKYFIQK